MDLMPYNTRIEEDGYDQTIHIEYDGEVVFSWYDSQAGESPEDLTWGRSISEVFNKGVELGRAMQRDGN